MIKAGEELLRLQAENLRLKNGIKQAREEMQEKAYYMDDIYCMKTIKIDDALEILDKLIAKSEG